MTTLEKQMAEHLFNNEENDNLGSAAEFISQEWIKPLERFGLEFQGYSNAGGFEDKGVHVLEFEQTDDYVDCVPYKFFEHLEIFEDIQLHYRDRYPNGKPKRTVNIVTLLSRDDDGQPPAEYSFFFGTLFVFIPWFS